MRVIDLTNDSDVVVGVSAEGPAYDLTEDKLVSE
jgi:hypothetical protein